MTFLSRKRSSAFSKSPPNGAIGNSAIGYTIVNGSHASSVRFIPYDDFSCRGDGSLSSPREFNMTGIKIPVAPLELRGAADGGGHGQLFYHREKEVEIPVVEAQSIEHLPDALKALGGEARGDRQPGLDEIP